MTTLLDILRYIRANPPDHGAYGICYEITLRPGFKSWGDYPDRGHSFEFKELLEVLGYDPPYPINDPLDSRSPEDQFEDTDNLWAGRQRELRLALLDECINHLEKQS